ncbi:hypothetical protein TMEC54S_02566 [Thauera mechernichensis]
MRTTEKRLRDSFAQIKDNLSHAGLLYDWNETVCEKAPIGRRITWATTSTRPDLSDASNSNIDEYLTFLIGRHYHYLLSDGSMIQMSYDLDTRNEVKQSRLVWYPCPVIFLPEELEYSSIEELVRTSPLEQIGCRSPLRFDYAPHQATNNHSTTHLHLGMEDFRFPVQRPLEPSRFARLIIRSAYPRIWSTLDCFKTAEDWNSADGLDEEDQIYGSISWLRPVVGPA